MDPRKLGLSQLVQLLNSTPSGQVTDRYRCIKIRDQAGLRIGDGKTIDLVRYVAWLIQEVAKPVVVKLSGGEAERERGIVNALAKSASIRNIGEIPKVVNPKRKARADGDFRFFCERYFPRMFYMAWSADHLKVIAKVERAVIEGGLFAMAMPRGAGKSSISETACMWAMLYGHRQFVALIGSDEGHATDMLDSIKTELENNDALLDDFPEAVFPIRCLDGISQRSAGQLYEGKQTHIGWTVIEIVMPTMPDSKASGAIIRVAGITGRIRGMKYKRIDGQAVRPSLVLIDDPQTDESARSLSQCATRERVLAGAILGLGGPGKKIAGLMTLTVVRPEDLADRILDRKKHPQWQGERTKMMYKFPTDEKLWDKYAVLRADGLRSDQGIKAATSFYRKNRKAMDEGAEVAWAQRYNHDELSALQHAMNLKLQDEIAFWAEYQNEPLPEQEADSELATVDDIMGKLNSHKRGLIPVAATHLTAFIDVHAGLHYWILCAWGDDFTGYVVDYGAEPDQREPHFAQAAAKRNLKAASPGTGREAYIYAGLDRLADRLLDREWTRDDGATMRVDRCLIDANWGPLTDTVYLFCRQSKHAALIMPSHGKYVGASSLPLSNYAKRPGDRVGLNWRVPVLARGAKRTIRHVIFDTNFWKTFVHTRLTVGMGDPGCLSLFGDKPAIHRLMAEHLTAEYRVPTVGRGRSVDEWKQLASHQDNHWLDCLVGCAVAGAMAGANLHGEKNTGYVSRKPWSGKTLGQLQREAKARYDARR